MTSKSNNFDEKDPKIYNEDIKFNFLISINRMNKVLFLKLNGDLVLGPLQNKILY